MPDPSSASGSRPAEPGRDWNDELRARLAPLKLHPTREAEIVDELSQHLELQYEELRRAGTEDEEARRLAAEELLGPEALAGYLRPLRKLAPPATLAPGAPRASLLRDLAQDLRAMRSARSGASQASLEPSSRWRSASAPTAPSSRWSMPRFSARCRFPSPSAW